MKVVAELISDGAIHSIIVTMIVMKAYVTGDLNGGIGNCFTFIYGGFGFFGGLTQSFLKLQKTMCHFILRLPKT